MALVRNKSLGQVAYETWDIEVGVPENVIPWDELAPQCQTLWVRVAAAVSKAYDRQRTAQPSRRKSSCRMTP
jgi:hypothetical protein